MVLSTSETNHGVVLSMFEAKHGAALSTIKASMVLYCQRLKPSTCGSVKI